MAITYGFFNSVNSDRVYNADQMSNYFEGIVSDGVFQDVDGGLQVYANTGMTVKVAGGRAFIDTRWMRNDTPYTVSISAASSTQSRYTAVVIKLDYVNRMIGITTVDGVPSTSPQRPEITDTGEVKYLVLAYVYVPSGSSTIPASNIQDMRGTSSCPWVRSILTLEQATYDVRYTSTSAAVGAKFRVNADGQEHKTNDVILVFFNGLRGTEGIEYHIEYNSSTGVCYVVLNKQYYNLELNITVITQV